MGRTSDLPCRGGSRVGPGQGSVNPTFHSKARCVSNGRVGLLYISCRFEEVLSLLGRLVLYAPLRDPPGERAFAGNTRGAGKERNRIPVNIRPSAVTWRIPRFLHRVRYRFLALREQAPSIHAGDDSSRLDIHRVIRMPHGGFRIIAGYCGHGDHRDHRSA